MLALAAPLVLLLAASVSAVPAPVSWRDGLLARQAGTCPSPQVSCVTQAPASCCFNAPGGQFLQTQFWDTNPVTGPKDSWTIHGLWPDNCDGSFSASCDPARAYTDITGILTSFNKTSLVTYMSTFMQSNNGSPESFWEHEWSKHGTCINTLQPSCYTNYVKGQEMADYFQRLVDLFKTLDTFKTLSAAQIVPSTSATYALADIQAALTKKFGFAVAISCKSGELDGVSYLFNVRGSLKSGDFVPGASSKSKGCPATGIKYLPK